MAIKDRNGGVSWNEWEEPLKNKESQAIENAKAELSRQIAFYKFQQYEFDRQWKRLRSYANENGIEIIGDIPIYVAFDSADTWSAPEMFRFNDALEPIDVAGCPPDGFSQTGQLWGNPLYDWEYHKKTGYDWWIRRIEHCFRLYDVVRIDHFRGFDEYYAVPYGEKTAVHGKWMPGPGIELFRTLEEKIGRKRIIAEDLGFLTPSVIQLLKESGFPGMKVLQFAFDSREDSNYLPHTYTRNCVVYTELTIMIRQKDGITRRQDQHGSLQKNTCISPVLMKIRLREILLLWQWEARRICASFRCRIIWDLEAMHELIRRPHLAGIGNGV